MLSAYTAILCSSFATVVPKLLDQKIIMMGEYKVGCIANAAEPEIQPGDPEPRRVTDDKDALRALGYTVTDIDLKQYTKKTLQSVLAGLDAVFVCGGNTFHLLDCMQKSGFADLIRDQLTRGLRYLSTSAGTCVTCPDIVYTKFDDDPTVAKLTSTKGLKFHDYYIDVHFGKESSDDIYVEKRPGKTAYMRDHNLSPLLFLSNHQALCLTRGSDIRLLV